MDRWWTVKRPMTRSDKAERQFELAVYVQVTLWLAGFSSILSLPFSQSVIYWSLFGSVSLSYVCISEDTVCKQSKEKSAAYTPWAFVWPTSLHLQVPSSETDHRSTNVRSRVRVNLSFTATSILCHSPTDGAPDNGTCSRPSITFPIYWNALQTVLLLLVPGLWHEATWATTSECNYAWTGPQIAHSAVDTVLLSLCDTVVCVCFSFQNHSWVCNYALTCCCC